jgi:plastocyanin
MKFQLTTALLIVWGGAACFAAGGIIEGKVRQGPPPPAATSAGRYQIKASAPVAPAESPRPVIYLEGSFPGVTNKPGVVQLGQKGFQFAQTVLPIQKGTTVEFPNMDDDYHNVFSYSKVKRFDLGRYKKDEKPATQRFEQPGVVKLFCEIHEHMRATILVLDTPFFQKAAEDGSFRLEGIPAGQYKAKAWLDEKTILEQPVEVKEGETIRVEFEKK